jgi:hypothetical protein
MNDMLVRITAAPRQGGAVRMRFALLISLLLLSRSAFGAEVLEEIIEQRHAVDPDVTFSIRNPDGSVQIYGGDGLEVSIQAIKKAYTPDRLKSILVDVTASRKGVAIETIIPSTKSALSLGDRSGTVEYIVTVPHAVRITKMDLVNGEIFVEGLSGGSATGHLVNGLLVAHNCFSDLDFTLVNGRLEAVYDWWENTKFSVKLSTVQANIWALVPSDASAGITARTGTGRIANAFEMQEEIPRDPVHALNFLIEAEPETAVEINSTSGNIRIDKTY